MFYINLLTKMKSSSFFNLNGDKKLNKLQILIYIFLNFLQNIYYNLIEKKFNYLRLNKNLKLLEFNKNKSISRNLCSLFWSSIDWKVVYDCLGPISVHEIGTGDGSYYKEEIAIPKKFLRNYNGYDVKKNHKWFLKKKNFFYNKFDGIEFDKTFKKNNNLFISQSCLEHVRYDLKYLLDLKKFSKSNKKKKIFYSLLAKSFLCFYLFSSRL